MKTDPLRIILDDNFPIDKKIYFISGNETTLMEKVSQSILEKYKKNKSLDIVKLESIEGFLNETSLFKNNKFYLGKNCKGINENNLLKIKQEDAVFVFIHENSQKSRLLKNLFIKNKESCSIDCYELDKDSKVRVLNEYLKLNKVKIKEDVFWFLIERLDNRYIFFEMALNKVLELDQSEITIENTNKLLSINESGKEKIFFKMFKKNQEIINAYKEKVVSNSDVYEFYYYCKYLCQMIIESQNEEEYIKKIPKYLFREKNFLIYFYNKFNFQKKILLLNLMSKTEIGLRKDSGLSLILGLRFFLSIKKITAS